MVKFLMSKKKIFIGGAFAENQFLYLIPILGQYAKYKKINTLIFEKQIPIKILKNSICQEILREFNCIEKKKASFLSIFKVFKYPNLLLFIFFNLNKLNKKKFSYFNNELLHGIWDLSLRSMNDNQLQPSLYQIIKSIIKNICEIDLTKVLVKDNIDTAFMGHNTYKYKSSIALFLMNNVNVFFQSSCSFIKQNINGRLFNIIEKNEFNKFKIINSNVANKYFIKRFKGRGNNVDIKIIDKIKFNFKKKSNVNVVFLHVLKDSPYGLIDNSRIFKDYFDWIIFTIRIISKSKEHWILKVHPSSFKWGENTKKIVNNIMQNEFGKNLPKNITLDYKGFTINQIIAKSNRIVTYNGTVHLEAVALGKKPIIISHTTLSKLKKNMVFKPISLKNYQDLLLNNKYNFHLEKKNMLIAKKVLYIIENYFSFIKNLNSIHFFPNDKKIVINKDFKQITQKLKANLNYLKFLGQRLFIGDNRTFVREFYKIFN